MGEADTLLRHLRHAEEWLRWARSDYRRGDLRGAVLRLLLVEAEVQRARETGVRLVEQAPAPRASRFPAIAVGALGAVTVVLVAVGYAALLSGSGASPTGAPAAQAAAAPAGPPGLVQLDTGNFLTLVQAQPGADAGGSGDGRVFDRRLAGGLLVRLGRGDVAPGVGPISLLIPGDEEKPSPAF